MSASGCSFSLLWLMLSKPKTIAGEKGRAAGTTQIKERGGREGGRAERRRRRKKKEEEVVVDGVEEKEVEKRRKRKAGRERQG